MVKLSVGTKILITKAGGPKHNMSNEEQNSFFAKPLLPSVYWLVAWLGCCIILGSIFYSNIQHQKRLDRIFDDYYKEISIKKGR